MDNHRAARRWLAFILIALGIVLPLLWLPTPVVHAATITVTTLVDEDVANGFCSLREAIIAANTNAAYKGCSAGTVGMDTITFNLPGTITLIGELPLFTQTLTINGHVVGTTISGNNSYRIMTICAGSSICNFAAGPTVNLSDLTIANGSSSTAGGLLIYNSTVNITNTTFVSNSASGNSIGGAIYSTLGNITITASSFFNNSAMDGGAIFSDGTSFMVSRSTFSGNSASGRAGAINYNSGGGFGFIVENSTIYSNTAGRGGAIVNSSVTTLRNSTIHGNTGITATGGITNSNGTTIFENTIVANNTGGNCATAVGAILSNSGYNIDSGTTCGFGSASGSMSNTDPRLAAFGNYGGLTKTMPPLPGSPAIDAVIGNVNCPATDQRGTLRPQGVRCDIGAVEAVYLFLPLILK